MKNIRFVAVLFAFCLAARLYANPLGGVVTSGSASITPSGNLLTIGQSSSTAIINWNTFNIALGQSTIFEFNGAAGANSAVLNLVTAGNGGSTIAGTLESTVGHGGPFGGTVLLLNPDGILFTPTATINVGSLVATTLGLPDQNDFLNKTTLHFGGTSTAGIQNQGSLNALGDIFLIAHTVQNSGVISAGNEAGLAAGTTVTLVQPGASGAERLTVVAGTGTGTPIGVDNTANGVINAVTTELKAAGGNIYALAINNGGVVRASTITQQGGHIYLSADGGNVVNSGTLDASGTGAGAVGGEVQVTGGQVTLASGSTVDVSGNAGGGAAIINGDQQTTVEQGALISADALGSGNGGSVSVLSSGTTEFYGSISAVGAGSAGAGGSAEISGAQLYLTGHADLTSPSGVYGTLLLDPGSLDIAHGADNGVGPSTANTIYDGWVNDQLAGGGLVLATSVTPVNGNPQDLTVDTGAAISWSAATALTLNGGNSITVNGTIAGSSPSSGLNLISGGTVAINNNISAGAVTLNNSGAATCGGFGLITAGTLTLNGAGNVAGPPGGPLQTAVTRLIDDKSGGNADVNQTGALNLDGTTTGPGGLNVVASGGITIDGPLNIHNGLGGGDSLTLVGTTIAINNPVTAEAVWLNNSGTASGSGLITASYLFLLEGGAVGTSPNPLQTAVTRLIDDKSDGDAYVNQTGASLDLYGATSGAGLLDVVASGGITIDAATLNIDGGANPAKDSLILNAAGSIAINGNVTAASVDMESALNFAGDTITFAAGPTIVQAAAQKYVASGNNADVNFNNALLQKSAGVQPDSFEWDQSASIGAPPALTLFGGGLVPGTYTLDSLNGNVTIPATYGVNLAGSILALKAPNGNIYIDDNLNLSSLSASGNTIDLNGTGGSETVTTSGGQTYNDPVVLTANATLSSSGGENITFDSTVDADLAANNRTLEVDTAGNEIFNGVVGGNQVLASLTTDGAGTVGGQAEFNMNLTLVPANVAGVNAGTVTINDGVLFNAADSILQGPTVRTTVGGQTYNGAATLGADTILADSAGKDITFNSTVDGAHRLTVDTVGNEIFNGVVGGTTALTSLTTDDPGAPETGTAGGQAEFNMNLTLVPANVAGVNAGTVTINDGVLFNAADSILQGPTVRTTVGGQTYNGAATLGADTILADSAGKDITFNSTVDGAHRLTVDTVGNEIFNGVVGGTTALTSLTTDNPGAPETGTAGGQAEFNMTAGTGVNNKAGVNAGTVTINDGAEIDVIGSTFATPSVQTSGGQTYNGAVVLTADTIINSGNNVTFGSTVDSQASKLWTLTVNAPGVTWFEGNVGGAANGQLGSLITDAAGETDLGNGGTVSVTTKADTTAGHVTTGEQTYNDAVVLKADTTLTAQQSDDATVKPNVTFGSTVDSQASKLWTLTVNAPGVTWFEGNVGGAANGQLGSLITDAAGETDLGNGGTVSVTTKADTTAGHVTTGEQTYNDAVVLKADTTLTAQQSDDTTVKPNVTFAKTVDGAQALEVDAAGNEIFNGVVGGNQVLASLTTDGAGTVGGQAEFNMNLTLVPANVAGVNAGTVTINDGVLFNAAASILQGPTVRTTVGGQTYNGAATLGADTILADSAGKDITFNSTVDGAHRLTVDTAGNEIFNGVVGGTTALTSLTTDDPGAPETGTAGGQAEFNMNLTLVPANVAGVNAGTVTINDGVLFNAAASILQGPTVRTTVGGQTYNGAATLGADTILADSAGKDITFNSTVDGAHRLTVDTVGNEIFNGVVGGTTALTSLTTDDPGAPETGTAGGQAEFNMNLTLVPANVAGVNAGTVTINDAVLFNAAASILQGPTVRTTVGGQTYNGAATLGADTILADSAGKDITFNSTVDGAHRLTVDTVGNEIFNGVVGGTTALTSLTTDNPGAPETGTAGGQAEFNMTAGTGVNNKAGVNAGTVTINDGAEIDVIGSTFATPSVQTSGGQTYNGAVVLTADTIINSGNNVTFGSTVDSQASKLWTLTVNAPGVTWFEGNVGGAANGQLGSLITDAAGETDLGNGGTVSVTTKADTTAGHVTTGEQTYNDAVVLKADTTLTAQQSDDATVKPNVTFGSTVDSQASKLWTLTVNAPGVTWFEGNVGGAANGQLGSLITDAAGETDLGNGGTVSVTTKADTTAGHVTTGEQTYNDAVVLKADTTLTAQQSDDTTVKPNVTFAKTVDGAQALEVDAAGNEIFNGVVGGNQVLASLTTDGAGTVGGQAEFNMNLTLVPANVAGVNAGTVTINDGVLFNAAASILQGPTVRTTVGGQTYNGAATLGADTILADSAGKDITFNSTVDGAHRLTVDTAGNEIFNGVVGGTTALTSLTTDDPGAPETGTAGGQAEFNMNLTLVPANVAGVNAGTVTINDGVLFNAADSILQGPTVRTTVGGQTYNGAATLGADTILADSAGKDITFNSTVDGAHRLTVDTVGNEIFNGVVGGTTALTSLTTDDPGAPETGTAGGQAEFNMNLTLVPANVAGVNAGTVTINDAVLFNAAASILQGPTVRTTVGGQTYNGAATLGADTILADSAGKDITFNSTVDGAHRLTVDTVGNEIFNGVVGGTTALTSLTTDNPGAPETGTAGGQAEFNMTAGTGVNNKAGVNAGTVTINDGAEIDVIGSTFATPSVQTSGGQTYNGAVVLTADTIINSGNNVTFGSTVDSQASKLWTLTVNAPGVTWFEGNVGGAANGQLGSLITDAAGETDLGNGGTVSVTTKADTTAGHVTTGEQTYNDAVVLKADTTLTAQQSDDATVKPNVTFGSTVDSQASKLWTLTVNAPGVTWFEGNVGGAANGQLGSLITDAAGETDLGNGGTVSVTTKADTTAGHVTTGEQTYNDAVVLKADTTLTAQQSDDTTVKPNVTFAKTVDGAQALEVDAAGNEIFNGVVGGNQVLASLTTDGAGTVGGQAEFNMNLTLVPANVAGVNAGTVTINDGVLFNAAASILQGPTVRTTVGGQTYNGAATLGADTILADSASGNIAFNTVNSTVNGGYNLTVDTAGTTTFDGAVGNTTPLASLTTDAPGQTDINGGSVATSGTQTYNDPVVLTADATLSSSGVEANGNITFVQTVNGAHNLTVDTAGTTTFDGPVGSTTPLASLTTDAPGQTDINADITTAGGQTYNDPVTLGGAGALRTLTGVNVDFANTLAGGGKSLTVDDSGTTTFGGAVSGVNALITDAPGQTDINGGSVATSGTQTYNDAVVLTADATLSSSGSGANGNITFDSTVDADLAVNNRTLEVDTAGNEIFNGVVGGNQALASLTTDGAGTVGGQAEFNMDVNTAPAGKAGVNAGSVTINDSVAFNAAHSSLAQPTVRTSGSQTYNGAATLGADTILADSASGNIAFNTVNSTVNGGYNLTVDTAGTTTFDGAVGNTTPLASLTTDAPGQTDINGGSVATSGTQTYNDPVVLTADAANTGSTINYESTVTGSYNLTDTGATIFGGSVNVASVLDNGSTAINGGGVTTSGSQTYNGAVTLGAATTLTSSGGGNITFDSTVDGAQALAVDTAGTTTFDGPVGSTTPLASLTTDAPGQTDINGGAVTTTGAQTYNDPVVLTATTVNSGTTINYESTVTGTPYSLTDNGATIFGGPVTVASLTDNGSTAINGGSVTTTAGQNYNGPVTLGADTILSDASDTINATSITANGFQLIFDLDGNIINVTGEQVGPLAQMLGAILPTYQPIEIRRHKPIRHGPRTELPPWMIIEPMNSTEVPF